MDIIRTMFTVSLVLVAAWLFLLFIGLCVQLNQVRRNWLDDNTSPIAPNFVFEGTLKGLGLSRFDRMTCGIFIFNALMLWPVSILVSVRAVKTLRDMERRALEKVMDDRNEPMRLSPENSTIPMAGKHTHQASHA